MATRPRRFSSAAGVIPVLILGAGLFAPAAASAAFGDDVVYTHPKHARSAADHDSAPVPCQGPTCSQAPVRAPMPVAPVNARVLAEQPLSPHAGEPAGPKSTSSLPIDSVSADPVRRTADVYHPPR